MVVQLRYRVHDAMVIQEKKSGGIPNGRSTKGRRGSVITRDHKGSTLLEVTESGLLPESHRVSSEAETVRRFLMINQSMEQDGQQAPLQ